MVLILRIFSQTATCKGFKITFVCKTVLDNLENISLAMSFYHFKILNAKRINDIKQLPIASNAKKATLFPKMKFSRLILMSPLTS